MARYIVEASVHITVDVAYEIVDWSDVEREDTEEEAQARWDRAKDKLNEAIRSIEFDIHGCRRWKIGEMTSAIHSIDPA